MSTGGPDEACGRASLKSIHNAYIVLHVRHWGLSCQDALCVEGQGVTRDFGGWSDVVWGWGARGWLPGLSTGVEESEGHVHKL